MLKRASPTLLTVLTVSLICAASGAQQDGPGRNGVDARLSGIPESAWRRLEGRRIFFGHQSVGYNIIDGIRDITRDGGPVRLNVVESADPASYAGPVFGHWRVGKNGDPASKIGAFQAFLEKGIGETADIAFFKFCYVDVDNETDVAALFQLYAEGIRRVKSRFPRLRVLHVTVPLTVEQRGFKETIKRWLGRKDRWYRANERRNRLNEMIRREYAGKNPIFELDRIESTTPRGDRTKVEGSGGNYFELYDGYTTDGGHLNQEGRKAAAAGLLAVLASIP